MFQQMSSFSRKLFFWVLVNEAVKSSILVVGQETPGTTTNLLVRYKNEDGRQYAMEAMTAAAINMGVLEDDLPTSMSNESPQFQCGSITVPTGDEQELITQDLLNSPDIESVEIDHLMYTTTGDASARVEAISETVKELLSKKQQEQQGHMVRPPRKLQSETTPYGIQMVQADQLATLSRSRQRMTVCVVDSGYLKHSFK